MKYESSITIDAAPKRVWDILTHAEAYPSWNPTVVRIDGAIRPDGRIKLYAAISPKRAFSLKVAELDAPRTMVWEGGMPLGLFKGVRTFTLSEAGEGTHFHMQEEFSGLMSGPITRSMPDLQPSFDEFAASLKRAAEA